MARHTKIKQVAKEIPVATTSGFTVKVNITFSMSDENHVTVSLNGTPGLPITQSSIISLQGVNHDDAISVDGAGEGTTIISIDKETSSLNPQNIASGPIHAFFNVT